MQSLHCLYSILTHSPYTNNQPLHLVCMHVAAEAKVTNLDCAVACNEAVARGQVSMHNRSIMNGNQS